MRRHIAPRAMVTLAIASSLLFAACGGGGGGSDSQSPTCSPITFDRALVSPAAGDVYLDESNATCSTIDIVILINNLSGIFTVSFDLNYPTAILDYQSFSLGPLILKGNPTTTPVVIVVPTTGGISVTASRLAPDGPVTASGSEAFLRLRFGRIGSGSGPIDFDTSAGSHVSEVVLDNSTPANIAPASFGPGHGGMVMAP
jgi:hypothetical protein